MILLALLLNNKKKPIFTPDANYLKLKKMIMKKLLLFFTVLISSAIYSQNYKSIVANYLNSNRTQYGLEQQDYSDLKLDSHSFSKSMNLENVYISQRYQGIEIFNTISSFAVKNGQVVNANLSFVNNLNLKITSTTPSISPQTAIEKAALSLGLNTPIGLEQLENPSQNEYVFTDGGISQENIKVKLVYQPTEDQTLKLAWDVSIYTTDSQHYYSVRIDSQTGELLSKHDWVIACDFGKPEFNTSLEQSILFTATDDDIEATAGGNQYNVFPMPLIGPNDGPQQLVANPADATASPFGWHDTDGNAGAEFTITRGNNVWAQEDTNGNNGVGFSPDGGASLDFNFPFNLPEPPSNFQEGAIVNLFYWNNIMHDVWYQYGFDEQSGNFQENNYGNGGVGSDSVNADAQDGSGTNNANFFPPPEGNNPRMQMFLWNAPGNVLGSFLTVNAPGSLAGSYLAADSNFGGTPLPTTPITADLALVEDDNSGTSTDPYDACDTVTNGATLTGKIAVIRRGECFFVEKVQKAEAEGAIAVIMVNNVPTAPFPMGGSGGGIGIPAVMIDSTDGEPIIDALINGTTVNATLVDDGSGTDTFQRDGDLDNMMIMHEYGHGISTRLTGGANNSGCLQNEEQMGEGWSDWFALMLTLKPGDTGQDVRGMSPYVLGQPINGQGIRGKVYTTDFTLNDYTYGDLPPLQVPHELGSVWATMLWDLTWAFIDEYGFDPDFYNGTGGNNIVMQLVIDGLKLQSCSPGFVNGRDAILQADELVNGGANRCLIWETFAARGLGASASQGSSLNSNDGVEAFDIPSGPDCTLSTGDRGVYDSNFVVYPNPTNGTFTIKSTLNVGDVTVSIFDINGRKVFEKDIDLQNRIILDVQGLTAGVYVVQINGNNYSHTTKLIFN